MRLYVSLPDDDVAFLDEYVQAQRLRSRSAALQRAVRLLRASELGSAYEAAWSESLDDSTSALWEAIAPESK